MRQFKKACFVSSLLGGPTAGGFLRSRQVIGQALEGLSKM
jgi:hypothetical protein